MGTDAEWERWGQEDPYYGVLTSDRFRKRNLTDDALKDFFESGQRQVDEVMATCRNCVDQDFQARRILDFGCGTGRLVVPFAMQAQQVVGIDVSDSMLREAERNCRRCSLQNVVLLRSDDSLSRLDGTFDLVHSFIVFQHIPPRRGRRIMGILLDHLAAGGICAIHVTYSKIVYARTNGLPPLSWHLKRPLRQAKRAVRAVFRSAFANRDPEMQMNSYSLNELFFSAQLLGAKAAHVQFTDHGGELGVYMYFQKQKQRSLSEQR